MTLTTALELAGLPTKLSKLIGRAFIFEPSDPSALVFCGSVRGLEFDGDELILNLEVGDHIINITRVKNSEFWQAEFGEDLTSFTCKGSFCLTD